MTPPVLVAGLSVLPTPSGVVVEGGPRRLRLTDPVVCQLLRQHGALDGRLDAADLAAGFGLDVEAVRSALAVLEDRGVVRPAPSAGSPTGGLGIYLGRRQPGTDAAELLSVASVAVVGDNALAGRIVTTLERCLVGTVRRVDDVADPPACDLLVLVDGAGPPPLGVPSVPVRMTGRQAEIGPLLEVLGGRCAVCCGPDPADAVEPAGATEPGGAVGLVVAGVVAGMVLAFLGRYGDCPLWTAKLRVDVASGTTEEIPIGNRADCPRCAAPGAPRLADSALDALDYEQSAETPVEGGERRPAPARRSSVAKLYLDLPRLRLRDVDGHTDGGLDTAVRLLRSVCVPDGRRRQTRRGDGGTGVLPSACDPGAVSVFVLPTRRPDGFRDGAFLDLDRQELVLLRPRREPDTEALERVRLALVVDLRTPWARFGRRGTRMVLQDAGFAAAGLLGAAAALGLTAAPVSDWHQTDVTGQLELPSWNATAVVLDVGLRPAATAVPPIPPAGMAYAYRPGAVDDETVQQLVDSVTGTLRRSGAASLLDGLRVASFDLSGSDPRGRFLPTDGSGSPVPSGPCLRLRDHLRRSGLDVPRLLAVTVDLRSVLTAGGADGYQASLVSASALAGLLATEARRRRLAAGLFSRLPSTLLFDRVSALDGGPRLLAGLGVGHATVDPSAAVVVAW
jgi:hypothetical protein